MKKRMCLLFALFVPLMLSAQPPNVDSLVNLLNANKTTSAEQLDIYYKICGTYLLMSGLDNAAEYADKALALAEKENDHLMASKFLAIKGRIYGTKSDYEAALEVYDKALGFAVKAGDKAQEAGVYGDIGITYARQEKTTQALEYFLKGLSLYEEIGENRSAIMVMANISSMYRTLENDERAIYYLEKAEAIAEEIGYEWGQMQVYFELGAIYYKRVTMENKPEYIDKAIEYELKAYDLSLKTGSVQYQTAITHALSIIYSDHLHDYDKALKYADESLAIAEQTGDVQMVTASWNSLSNVYLALKRYKEAEEAALNGWEADSLEKHTGSDLLKNIMLANMAMGNSDKAKEYFAKYDNYVRTQTSQSNREIMADMEVKYETEKKEAHIASLEEKQKLYIIIGVAVVAALLLGLGFLLYRHRSKRKLAEQQIKQLEQENELIAAHSALEAEKAERETIARDLHDGVGAMLSVVKNNMDIMKSYSIIENTQVDYFNKALDGLDKSIAELRRVAHHIMPASLIENGLPAALEDFCRSTPKVEFHYQEPCRRFDAQKELTLYRCAYELVNNALRHSGASRIDVHLGMDEQAVYLSVVDNGCGFDPQAVKAGMGMNNMRARLAAFNGRIDIYSEPEKGTEVNVEIEIG